MWTINFLLCGFILFLYLEEDGWQRMMNGEYDHHDDEEDEW